MDINRRLHRFLQDDLGIPQESIEMATRYAYSSAGSIPMVLWQYGLIDLNQLDKVFDWMETV
ncbi:conserved hypothetical protein [Gloeothece citriformis PCC 7424]|uniref:DUF2949 domain-containing protein n=1 Tax=Gloeothece citriformis (strain PCC 7424) TaxID=65393 RepID=B7KCS8_GLOC7|nr:DUF2949 domain-containing protein [Gloeothece citriformis]ACK71629.1 conserved hypothetical protein [Gloeothece citriformis PCC 7424]